MCLQGGSTVYVLTLSFLAALLPNALSDVAAVVGATCYITLVAHISTSLSVLS